MSTHFQGTEPEQRALDLFIKLVRASAAVEARTSAPVLTAGLTSTQFGALETLYHLGPRPIGQLAEKHLKSPNNFTVVISNLEKQGLVRRDRSEADRRVVVIELTATGRGVVEQILPDYVQRIVEDLSVLTSAEQRQLGGLLRKLGRGDL